MGIGTGGMELESMTKRQEIEDPNSCLNRGPDDGLNPHLPRSENLGWMNL